MTLELTLCLPDLSGVPFGCRVATAIVVWYVFAALVVRFAFGFIVQSVDDPGFRLFAWAFSPFVFVVSLGYWVLGPVLLAFSHYVLTPKESR